ncbi:MAG: EamA family transporter [Verrucomicrobia bacterium]|nr:EamA family transporter [Verrucomicrobiota bacterium]
MRDYMQLHGLIVLWGITSIIGRWISLPSLELVFYRTALAAAALGMIAVWRKQSLRVTRGDALILVANGSVIALHWIMFFLAAKISSASVCLAGLATCTLWTALLQPLFFRTFKWHGHQIVLGIIMASALTIIVHYQPTASVGLAVALVSAFFATVFSLFNALLIRRHHFLVMTFYELAGAAVFCAILTPIYLYRLSETGTIAIPTTENGWTWLLVLSSETGTFAIPTTGSDWAWLLVLSLVCTVLAFTGYVELLNRMDVFTINLAANLEPVYGMILAAALDGDWHKLSVGFYGGSLLILTTILAYPWFERRITGRVAAAAVAS